MTTPRPAMTTTRPRLMRPVRALPNLPDAPRLPRAPHLPHFRRMRHVRLLPRLRPILLLRSDAGAATAEYAIATLAAVGFAGLLVVILRSDEVRGMLTDLVRNALSIPG